jgi:hypothetical protein
MFQISKYNKHIFYFGLIAYAVSFFLPAISSGQGEHVFGYYCFWIVTFGLLQYGSGVHYLSIIFMNIPNVFVLVNLYWFFKSKPKYGFLLSIAGIVSAVNWIIWCYNENGDIDVLNIGYYLWTLSIILMSLHLFQRKEKDSKQ